MSAQPIVRIVATAASAALLVTALTASAAAAAQDARPTCAGRVATIVGTAEGETIIGTAGRDVIVARGGNDRILGRGGKDIICGGPGNDTIVGHADRDVIHGGRGDDRLFGGPGDDKLYGGPGDDRFDGGEGWWNRCNQGTGDGDRFHCEVPRIERVGKTFAVAFVDLDDDDRIDPTDVLISRVIDTNRDGIPSKGDTIEMGRYPTTRNPKDVGDTRAWGVTRHSVEYVEFYDRGGLSITSTTSGRHVWYHDRRQEFYAEGELLSDDTDGIGDGLARDTIDYVSLSTRSPSRPSSSMDLVQKHPGDDGLIDVRTYFQVP